MSYRRDFTIGLKETQDFYLSLVLGHWMKGLLGFGAVGALAAVMYTMNSDLSMAVRAALAAGAAIAVTALGAVILAASTCRKVRRQLRASGRGSYVQETDINGFGVHVAVGRDRAKLAFENLVEVRETRKAFYLFISDNQAWILPKAQMDDAQAESAQLRALFASVVEQGRLKLKK